MRLTTVPLGLREGTPAILCTSDDLVDPDVLVRALVRDGAPGVRAVVLDLTSDAWVGDGLARALIALSSDPRFEEVEPWCVRPIGSEGWSWVPTRWVCDLGPVLRTARTVDDVIQTVSDLMSANPFPPPTELYVGPDVDIRNIVPAVLNELHTRLQCAEQGFLYAREGDLATARNVASATATPWLVRRA